MYYNNYIFSFAQDSVAKKITEGSELYQGHGQNIYTAMENQLQELNVKRQAYHSNNFVGNHVNTCLKAFFAIVIKSRLKIPKRFDTNW